MHEQDDRKRPRPYREAEVPDERELPGLKVNSSTLAGWGCLAQAGRSSKTASRMVASEISLRLKLWIV
jgi:hypothetical protein